jgi:3-oxoadipate enol-lactonase
MRTQVNDYNLVFEDRGRGLTLLLIHGYPLNRDLWKPQLEGLSSRARVLAPDLRGHGDSQALPGIYTMDLLAGDCAALLDSLKISRPVVVCGLSMGGYVSFALFRKYPERVAGLILAATRAGADSPDGKAKRDQTANLAREKGLKPVVESMLPKMLSPKTYKNQPELVQRAKEIMLKTSLEGVIGDLMGMKERPDSTPMLDKIDKPVLILHGEDDQIIPIDEIERMQAGIAHAQLRVLPEAGHLLNLEQPVLFNAAVSEFLDKLPG